MQPESYKDLKGRGNHAVRLELNMLYILLIWTLNLFTHTPFHQSGSFFHLHRARRLLFLLCLLSVTALILAALEQAHIPTMYLSVAPKVLVTFSIHTFTFMVANNMIIIYFSGSSLINLSNAPTFLLCRKYVYNWYRTKFTYISEHFHLPLIKVNYLKH